MDVRNRVPEDEETKFPVNTNGTRVSLLGPIRDIKFQSTNRWN